MSTKLEEIERLAMAGEMLPKGYTQPEQLIYLSFRSLHWEYRHGIITREQAKEEKSRLVQEFGTQKRFCEIYKDAVRIRNTLSHKLTEAEKNGCPRCQEIVKIFDGRK